MGIKKKIREYGLRCHFWYTNYYYYYYYSFYFKVRFHKILPIRLRWSKIFSLIINWNLYRCNIMKNIEHNGNEKVRENLALLTGVIFFIQNNNSNKAYMSSFFFKV